MTNRPRLHHDLTSDEVDQIVDWFMESYKAGWRPTMLDNRGRASTYTPFHAEEIYAKLTGQPTQDDRIRARMRELEAK